MRIWFLLRQLLSKPNIINLNSSSVRQKISSLLIGSSKAYLKKAITRFGKSFKKRLLKIEKKSKSLLSFFVDEKNFSMIAILRIRNEELILQDTLNHLSGFCDGIIVYDDASTDSTVKIAKKHRAVLKVIRNRKWKKEIDQRLKAETEQRKMALKKALSYNPEWIFCADADERYIGNISDFIKSDESKSVDGVRISLFDAYFTKDDQLPYSDGKLINLRKNFGPERRDILMMWRASAAAEYHGLDKREPTISSNKIATKFYCQHFGKAISISQWEETCDYYTKHFPYETYGKKWESRKGKAIHDLSDFGARLFSFGDDLFDSAIKIHPNKKSVLLITHFLRDFTGSELAIYDLAREFLNNDYEVSVGAFIYADPLLSLFNNLPVRLVDLNRLSLEYFDLIWSQHFTTIERCMASGIKAEKIIFSSLSPYEPLESPPLCIDKVSLFLANSNETKDTLTNMGIESQDVMVFPNPAPKEFFCNPTKERVRNKIEKIAVVSNTTQKELEECSSFFTDNNISVDFFGFHKNTIIITPEVLNDYDLVITIGRTVQYCLSMGIPVYCYDRFGGPGYISEKNIEAAKYYNFSGRCSIDSKRDPETIFQEISEQFTEIVKLKSFYKSYAKSNFQLSKNLELVIKRIELLTTKSVVISDNDLIKNIRNRQQVYYDRLAK